MSEYIEGQLQEIRKKLMAMQEAHLEFLCREDGQTKLYRAFCKFLREIDQASQAIYKKEIE